MPRESKVLRYMTNMATPEPITRAMARAWPLIRQRSRSSLRSRARDHGRAHQHQLVGGGRRFAVAALVRDAAVGHGDHAVGHVGDGGVVGDDDADGAELAVDALDRLQHHDAGGDVERAGGLVAEQHVRPLGDGAGDGHALLLAAGELRREVVHAVAEADQRQRLLGRHRVVGDLGDQGDVLARGEAGDQVVELEDEADVMRGGSG